MSQECWAGKCASKNRWSNLGESIVRDLIFYSFFCWVPLFVFDDRLSTQRTLISKKTEVRELTGCYTNCGTVYRAGLSRFSSFNLLSSATLLFFTLFPLICSSLLLKPAMSFMTERFAHTHVWSLWNRRPQRTLFWIFSASLYCRAQCPAIIIIPKWLPNVIIIKLPNLP